MSDRASGNPKYITEMLDAIAKAGLIKYETADDGTPRLIPRTAAELEAVQVPSKMKATVMQQFDSLDPSLQAAATATATQPQPS